MAWDADTPADADTAASMMTGTLANWTEIQTVCTSTRMDNLTAIPDYFPTGTVCFFYKDAAPTGWTLFSDASDELLAIKGGSVYEFGGQQAGTWQQPDHTLTVDEIPSHSHTYTAPNSPENKRRTNGSSIVTGISAGTSTSSVGGGQAHNHGTSWRPSARVGILCTKDAP